MEGSEEQHFISQPQTDLGNHQPQPQQQQQQKQQQLGLGFQSSSPPYSPPHDPNPDPNLDPPPVDDKLQKLLIRELQNLTLKEAINEEAQNLAWKQATDEEVELKQAIDDEIHYLALTQAINEALQKQGSNQAIDEEIHLNQFAKEEFQHQVLRRVIDEALRNHTLKKTEARERETDREDVVKDESKNETQSPAWEENEVNEKDWDHEYDVKDDNKDEYWNDNDGIKVEEGIGNDYDNESESEKVEGDDENENEGGESGMVALSNDGKYRRYHYPFRPDAEDCAYYMKTGTCKFGLNCKFNHPPRRKNQPAKEKVKQKEENPERPGQTECKYYLTSGGCKFGKACRYNHSRGKPSVAPILEFNFLGLPIRPGEKECPYYMRNGSCKYGSNCRFNHPDPTAVGGSDPPSTYGNGGSASLRGASQSTMSSWSSPRTLNEPAPFVPMMFPPTQGVPSPNPDWNGYQAPLYPTSERSLPTPPAFAMNNPATDTNFYTHRQQQMLVEEYPERPGQPECSYFLKTGACKYKSGCKFHHPKNRNSKTSPYLLSDKGLPLRPDQNICTHYSRYGICKFGPACKYNHPGNYGNSDPSAGPGMDQPPSFGNLATADGARSANGSESFIQQSV